MPPTTFTGGPIAGVHETVYDVIEDAPASTGGLKATLNVRSDGETVTFCGTVGIPSLIPPTAIEAAEYPAAFADDTVQE